MSQSLDHLNPEQKDAVCTTEGFVRVIAGAGSGKTRALAHRFAYLVNDLGILPAGILCVTFSNKSALEMRQRIHRLAGDNDTGLICTFHSFCVSVLQEDSHALQYPKSFLVLDNVDIDAMLQTIYDERGLTLRDMTFGQARDLIEIRKIFKEPDYWRDIVAMPLDIIKAKYDSAQDVGDIVFYGYLYQAKKCFGVDYNDLIIFTLAIFGRNPEIRDKWQQRLEYIMIDEFQDIDELQYRLMEALCAWHKNLFIVGDPDQTIYTWRGASTRYLMDFDQSHPDTKTILMTRNYRSTPQILAVVNSLIAKNTHRIKKNLRPELPSGIKPVCHHAQTSEQEAKWIAQRIRALAQDGVRLADIAVLFRANYVTRTLEQAFVKEKIPYTIYSGVQFFGRKEIKDALSYLRMIVYKDDLSFVRVVNEPKRNIGRRRMEFLTQYAAEHGCSLYAALQATLDDDIFKGTKARHFVRMIETFSAESEGRPISEVLAHILNDSGYEKALRTAGAQNRLDNLAELKQSVYEFETTCGEETTLAQYLRYAALFSNRDAEGAPDRVKLMTVHTAKGLEFGHVFVCAMNEGIFPSKKTKSEEAMEEERRLAFVAMTRAQQGLYLTEAAGRNFDGSPRFPSRFILDINPDLLEWTTPPREEWVREARAWIERGDAALRQQVPGPALEPGERVRHAVFGPGRITGLDHDKNAYIIQFDSIATPRLIAWKVRLEEE